MKKTKNFERGINPHTGKQFLIIERRGLKPVVVDSYQTRIAAVRARGKGNLIIRADRLEQTIKNWKDRKEKNKRLRNNLKSQIGQIVSSEEYKKSNAKDNPLETKVKGLRKRLSSIKDFDPFDTTYLIEWLKENK